MFKYFHPSVEEIWQQSFVLMWR